MTKCLPIALAAALVAAGCAGPVATEVIGPDHPASPTAASAPMPEPSRTLAVHADSAGLNESTTGMATATSPAAGMYVCPMHPEVRSGNPNDRCPKCGMKIDKPVGAASAPAAGPTAGHDSHSHHGGHE